MDKILHDHKKTGNVLTPPLLTLDNLQDSNYIENTIPELIWISLLNGKYGLKFGTELGLRFVQIVQKIIASEEVPFYISYFLKVNQNNLSSVKNEMKKQGIYYVINNSISPLLSLYPLCPLNRLFIAEKYSPSDIDLIKSTLYKLYDKRSKEATFTLGNVIYFLRIQGKLNIVKGSLLSELPKLIDYPKTELSKQIASQIRAASNVMFQKTFIESDEKWINHFWNTGIQLEPCEI